MGIKGTVRRSTDGDFIHANVDIDLIITEEVNLVIIFVIFIPDFETEICLEIYEGKKLAISGI